MTSSRRLLVRPLPLGFTLVELLVVMIIIGLLMSLLLPAIQAARESARVTSCASNLRQIALAASNYEARTHFYPPSWKPTPPIPGSNVVDGWSALALLLPFLEQGELYSTIDFQQSYDVAQKIVTADGATTKLTAMRVPTYLCPSERRDEVAYEDGVPANYPLNYALNLGVWFVWDPVSKRGGAGAFFPDSRLRASDFRDGLSYTLCAAEVKAWQPYYRNAAFGAPVQPNGPTAIAALGGQFKSSSGHTEWVDGRVHQTGFTTTFRPNTDVSCVENATAYDVDWTNQQEGKSATAPTYAAVTARSYHRAGLNAVMMDGSVRWFSDEVNLGVWRAYSTRAGDEIVPSEGQAP